MSAGVIIGVWDEGSESPIPDGIAGFPCIEDLDRWLATLHTVPRPVVQGIVMNEDGALYIAV